MRYEILIPRSLAFLALAVLLTANNSKADTPQITSGKSLQFNANAPQTILPAPDPSAIRKQLEAVRADNQRLRNEMKDLSKTLVDMENNTPSCLDNTTSTTKSGIKTDCWPRTCDNETGLCVPKPVTSADCTGGFSLWGDRCSTNDIPSGCPNGYHMKTVDSETHLSTCVPDAPLDCGPNHVWSDEQDGCVPRDSR